VAVQRAPELADLHAAKIREIYDNAQMRILAEVRRRTAAGLKTPGWAERKAAEVAALRKWLKNEIGTGPLADIPQELEAIIREAYDTGGQAVAEELIAANLPTPAAQAYVRGASIRALAADTVGAVVSTHPAILRTTLDAYRDVIASSAADVLTGVATRYTATQSALNAFADRGVTGFIDKAGRSWDLGSYAEMATRTAVIRSAKTGAVDKYTASGQDLVIVSSHSESCSVCDFWEGKVLSITGKTPGYPTLAEAEADGLFHGNCRHVINLYTPGLTRVPEPKTKKEHEENAKVYAERMRQRRLERGVRQWKRREVAALDDTEAKKAKAKVKQWRGALSEHIETVNARREATGSYAARRFPKREQVTGAPAKPRGVTFDAIPDTPEMRSYLASRFDKPLTSKEVAVLGDYKTTAYREINQALRGHGEMPSEYRGHVKVLDALTTQETLGKNGILQRGASYDAFGGQDAFKNPADLIGRVLEEPAYLSTSFGGEAERVFGYKPVLMKIEAPADTRCYSFEAYSRKTRGGADSEREILLPRNTKMRVKEVIKGRGRIETPDGEMVEDDQWTVILAIQEG
jgi:hypothetical protein